MKKPKNHKGRKASKLAKARRWRLDADIAKMKFIRRKQNLFPLDQEFTTGPLHDVIEVRRFTQEEICRFFSVPPEMLGKDRP